MSLDVARMTVWPTKGETMEILPEDINTKLLPSPDMLLLQKHTENSHQPLPVLPHSRFKATISQNILVWYLLTMALNSFLVPKPWSASFFFKNGALLYFIVGSYVLYKGNIQCLPRFSALSPYRCRVCQLSGTQRSSRSATVRFKGSVRYSSFSRVNHSYRSGIEFLRKIRRSLFMVQ